jgi:uncharacterized protein (DUF427 family)
MTIDLRAQQREQRTQLRYASTAKRLRVSREGALVCDTTDALVVWLPRQVVPQYAVPVTELVGGLVGGLPVGAVALEGDGVDDHVLLPFGDFDWLEEDEPVIGHPHDPFARIDVLHSTREVRVELDGVELACSRRPLGLFETGLPTRWYLPAHDVRTELLTLSDTRTTCAYKGHASYLSAPGEDGRDIAWCYRSPQREAEPIRDMLCFWAERTVTTVDGVREHGLTDPLPVDA